MYYLCSKEAIDLARFYLVRHGQTLWNVERKYQGQSDVPLTKIGKLQAEQVADKLKDKDIKAIYASDLSRTVHTAREIAKHHNLEVINDKDIRELSLGVWEGLTFNEVNERWSKEFREWQEKPFEIKPPEGETLTDLYNRTGRFMMRAAKAHPKEKIIVVTHAGPIRAILAQILNLKRDFFWKFKISNTSVTELVYRGEEELSESDAFIGQVNDTCHLYDLKREAESK